tara:strand:- start:1156 stop:1314 length:159 start_codon:yes stop_codon:yes gene_type:complete
LRPVDGGGEDTLTCVIGVLLGAAANEPMDTKYMIKKTIELLISFCSSKRKKY